MIPFRESPCSQMVGLPYINANLAAMPAQTPTATLFVAGRFEPLVSVEHLFFHATVLIPHADGGRTVTVAITDRCEGCGLTDLDFSPAAFTALASDLNIGRIHGMTWVWV